MQLTFTYYTRLLVSMAAPPPAGAAAAILIILTAWLLIVSPGHAFPRIPGAVFQLPTPSRIVIVRSKTASGGDAPSPNSGDQIEWMLAPLPSEEVLADFGVAPPPGN